MASRFHRDHLDVPAWDDLSPEIEAGLIARDLDAARALADVLPIGSKDRGLVLRTIEVRLGRLEALTSTPQAGALLGPAAVRATALWTDRQSAGR